MFKIIEIFYNRCPTPHYIAHYFSYHSFHMLIPNTIPMVTQNAIKCQIQISISYGQHNVWSLFCLFQLTLISIVA